MTAAADERLRAIALHGRMLEFEHPMLREPRKVEAPLPDVWNGLNLRASQSEEPE